MRVLRCMLVVWCAVTAAIAHAAPENVMTQGGVTFVSGGIGLDARQRMQALEPQFNGKLVFTLTEGNYLSDVDVSVRDAAGKTLIKHVADGPFMLIRLPAGKYSVTAIYDGRTQVRQVQLRDGRLHTEYLRWAGNPETDFPLPPEHLRETMKQ